jgi:hypothetical protein
MDYFIQPAELVGTDRYKIGCSANTNLSRLTNGPYRIGTRYIIVVECSQPFKLEKLIKTRFTEKFKLIAGTEYFEGNEAEMKKEFYDIILNYTIEKPLKKKL